ncbi:hypothetical protein WK13_34705 [Burkholderia ubonensis]|uniref:hypothetical protein n=1 Tax=Burkholderia ubonensis TaxID=101571 RepID=UPI000755554C|nr:hypothetical protein [Burkholderia ubonensis]KVR21691.1 hypothetical protein WK13_34705 [Burkholderia ubonensis]
MKKTPTAYRITIPGSDPVYAKELTRKAAKHAHDHGVKVERLYTDEWLDPAMVTPEFAAHRQMRAIAIFKSRVEANRLHVGEAVYDPVSGWRAVGRLGWNWVIIRWQPLPEIPELSDLPELLTL